jgi:hypothetical protein
MLLVTNSVVFGDMWVGVLLCCCDEGAMVWYGMVFRGGFPHAPRPLYGLLYDPFEFQISRHTLAARWCRLPHLAENGGTICRRNWKLCTWTGNGR